jgi:hypothetical protein
MATVELHLLSVVPLEEEHPRMVALSEVAHEEVA